jgi:hypothetical protein
VIKKKKRRLTDGLPERPTPGRLRYPVVVLFRMFVIGSVAIIACLWAIWRHYNVPRVPMLVPVTATPSPSTSPSAAAASEIEIETAP